MKSFIVVLITLIVLVVLGAVFLYSGIYNPSAAKEGGNFIDWVLVTAKNNSVESHANNIEIPDLSDPSLIKEGFHHYDEMCVMCHGAPGVEESEAAKGLNPHPPELYKADELEPKEIFWAVKNGIKMTGMPSFGVTHSDEKIAAITAFVTKELNQMDAKEYQSWRRNMKEKEEEKEEENE